MELLTTADDLRAYRRGLSGPVALLPTMGALHAGHLTHLGAARAAGAGHVIVSVFVNPTQFGPGEDLDRYPREPDTDAAKCAAAGADAVFIPGVQDLYPPDAEATPATLDVPAVTRDAGLEAARRPGHFAGVCRVVLKLLNLTQPDLATFGRKDYQQLCVVRAAVRDLMLPVEIVAVPTAREDDGLAMSSRNRHLDPGQRRNAPGLAKALRQARRLADSGETDPAALEVAMREVLNAHRVAVDYAAVRRRGTLAPVDAVDPARSIALVAGRLGDVRLIDNLGLDENL